MTESVPNEYPLISEQARRHHEMRLEVLKGHPEVLGLAGPEYRTAFAPPVLLAIHWSLAAAVFGPISGNFDNSRSTDRTCKSSCEKGISILC